MSLTISINFHDVAPPNATIPILDHGFLFGDSVYEVVRTWQGRLLFADEHLARLRNSANGIGLELPHSADDYKREFRRMHARSGNADSYVRLIVTRGVGELELATRTCHDPCSIVIVKPLNVWEPALYERGGKLSIVSILRNSPRATNPAYKTGNYLNNVLAVEESRKTGATEALMLSAQGHLTECTTANVFLVKGGRVLTPELGVGILSGVTRAKVLELCAKLGIPHQASLLTVDDLTGADEVFITSTTRDVMPITSVDDNTIAGGRPGTVTLRLLGAFRELCSDSAER